MDSKKIINVILLTFLLFPLFYVSAENKDYLAIDLQFNFKNQQFSILKIEQKIFGASDAPEYENPTYVLTLVRGDRVISSTRFPVPEQKNYSVSNEEGTHIDAGYVDVEIMNVLLTVTEPIQPGVDRIEINDSTGKIFSQALSGIPIDVLSGTQPLVPDIEQPEVVLSEPLEPEAKKLNVTMVLVVGAILVLIFELYRKFRISKKRPEDNIEVPTE